jgi:hypothetical protein
MNQEANTVIKEKVVAGFLALLGIFSLAVALIAGQASKMQSRDFWLTVLFTGSIILADHFPIHIFRGTKVSLTNLPIYLSAVLLPAPLAVLATGTGILIANVVAVNERGLLPRDIVSSVGQWMFTAFLGNQITHLTFLRSDPLTSKYGLLLLAAFAFLLVDFLMFSLSQAFVFGEPFLSMLRSVAREGIVIELSQYLTAILGALAAYQDIGSLVLLIVPVSITYIAFKNLKEIHKETVQILEDMADTVDLRDIYTGGHSKRVADLVTQTLTQLKISGPEATLIEISARLHDIGKIGIPDSILVKPSTLSSSEMAVMKTHSQKGAELISKYKDFARGAEIIKHHHERWDGRGYPSGLRGFEIPFGARVIAVADSFDAMTSDRPYRKAMSDNQAIQTLLMGRGKQWDTSVVNAFVDMITKQLDEVPHSDPADANFSHEFLPVMPTSAQ